MGHINTASTCRWAAPTLLLTGPVWLNAEEFPWTCTRIAGRRLLETTEVCADCPHWMPHDPCAPTAEWPAES